MTTTAESVSQTLPSSVLTKEQKEAFIAYIRERNKDPEYRESLKRTALATQEYRNEIEAQERRARDEEEGK